MIYRVTINGTEKYEGNYTSMPDAVFGALKKWYIDYNRTSPYLEPRRPANAKEQGEFQERLQSYYRNHPSKRQPWSIEVEEVGIAKRGQYHKAKRVP